MYKFIFSQKRACTVNVKKKLNNFIKLILIHYNCL